MYNAGMNHLYIAHAPKTNFYKIGIARVPERRLRQLRRDFRDDLYFVRLWPVEQAASLEKWLHRELAKWRRHAHVRAGGYTEWFDLTEQSVRLLRILTAQRITSSRRRTGQWEWLRGLRTREFTTRFVESDN